LLLLWQNRLEGRYQKHKRANIRKLQRKNSTQESHDGNRGTECFECAINEEEKCLDSPNEEKLRLVIKRGNNSPNPRNEQSDPHTQTKHKQKHAQKGDNEPADHVEYGSHKKDKRRHHAQNKVQVKQRYLM